MNKKIVIFFVFFILAQTANAETCISGSYATKGANNGYSRVISEIESAKNREENAATLLENCLKGLRDIKFDVSFPSFQFSLDAIIEKVCKLAVNAANEIVLNDIASDISDYEKYLNSISNQVQNDANNILDGSEFLNKNRNSFY